MKPESVSTVVLLIIALLIGGYVAHGLANYEPNPVYDYQYSHVRHSDDYIYANAPRPVVPYQYSISKRSIVKSGGIILRHPSRS